MPTFIKKPIAIEAIEWTGENGDFIFGNGEATETMRIDSSGNLLVGQSTASTSSPGSIFTSSGKGYHIVTGGTALFVAIIFLGLAL